MLYALSLLSYLGDTAFYGHFYSMLAASSRYIEISSGRCKAPHSTTRAHPLTTTLMRVGEVCGLLVRGPQALKGGGGGAGNLLSILAGLGGKAGLG